MPGQTSLPDTPSLCDLPLPALVSIVRYVLKFSSDAELRAGSSTALSAAVRLARIHPKLRSAVSKSILSINFGRSPLVWPAARVLGPAVPEHLHTLDVTIDRSCFIGFLKWILPARELRVLHLRVTGRPYGRDALQDLERKLLGRLFTRIGITLESLDVDGIDPNTLLMSTCCRCTALTHLNLRYDTSPQDAAKSASPALNLCLFLILCLVNRDHLRSAYFLAHIPGHDVSEELSHDGCQISSMLETVWTTLWTNYRAGIKEAAVNLPEDESELVEIFQLTCSRMDVTETTVREAIDQLKRLAPRLASHDLPHALVTEMAPKVHEVNIALKPSTLPSVFWERLSIVPRVDSLRIDDSNFCITPRDIVNLRSSFPQLKSLSMNLAIPVVEHGAQRSESYDGSLPGCPRSARVTNLCSVIAAVCSEFRTGLRHLYLTVTGCHGIDIVGRIKDSLIEMEPGLLSLTLNIDDCHNLETLGPVLRRQGRSLRRCELTANVCGRVDTTFARRRILTSLVRYCNPEVLKRIYLPHWMLVSEYQLLRELASAASLLSKGPNSGHGDQTFLGLSDNEFIDRRSEWSCDSGTAKPCEVGDFSLSETTILFHS